MTIPIEGVIAVVAFGSWCIGVIMGLLLAAVAEVAREEREATNDQQSK
jgi:hypothetical protein